MSGDVIDLIDGAVRAHGDAMRWSPTTTDVVFTNRALPLPHRWRADTQGHDVVAGTFDRFASACQQTVPPLVAVGASFERLREAAIRSLAQALDIPPELLGQGRVRFTGRLSSMHTAYRRRRR